jgi:phenylpropionate dioxygenase-like ring-hydroxylating dioxygenase large terminal subunit
MMFINFWYPADESSAVTEQPLKKRMLGQDFVLFRDSAGNAHCLSNTCTHRGGSLGDGKVKGDCIECPYHGWQFDGEGNCQRIPSLGIDAKIPGRTRIDTYPVVERYGLVFCFLGDLPESERPPIMDLPEWGKDGWTHTIQRFQFDIDYQRSMENGLDPAHNEFVHDTHGYSGDRDDYRTPDVVLEDTEWGTGFGTEIMAPPLPEKEMHKASGRSGDQVIWVGTGHEGVCSLWTFIHPSESMHLHQYAFETPIDENRTTIFLVNLRNVMLEDSHDERIMERNAYVAYQDRDVLDQLHPRHTPPTRTNEFFMPSDGAVGRYRERISDWEARGWRIDVEAVRQNEKTVAYAIPCPKRRQQKGWVVDSIPLLEATSDAQVTQQSA